MKKTLVEIKSISGVKEVRVDTTNVHTLRKDLRKHNAELSEVQMNRFLEQGVGTHFDMDEHTYEFSVGYQVKKLG